MQRGLTSRWWTPDLRMGVSHSLVNDFRFGDIPHTHGEYAFIVCLKGKIEFECGTDRYELEAGEMIVHNPGQVHQSRYGLGPTPSENFTLYFHPLALGKILAKLSFPYDPHSQKIMFLGKVRHPNLLSLGKELIHELQSREFGCEVLMESLAVQILVYLLRHCLEPTIVKFDFGLPRQLPVKEMSQVMDYMAGRGKKDFNLSELCQVIGTSPSRFIPLFRNSTQLYPHVYFDRCLIQKAQMLLQTNQAAIKEVAYELGFQNESHFCKTFRNVVGTTPNRYRQLTTDTLSANRKILAAPVGQ